MNFLAHFELAGDRDEYIVGALLGDYIKGPLANVDLPQPVKNGIQLHRAIDAHTDRLPSLTELGRLLPAPAQRYKGILTDLFFDYALVQHWHRYQSQKLEQYASQVIDILSAHQPLLNAPATDMLQRLQRYNLLCRYSEKPVIDGVIASIGSRLNRSEQIELARNSMWQLEKEWEQGFLEIYPGIRQFAEEQRLLLEQQDESWTSGESQTR